MYMANNISNFLYLKTPFTPPRNALNDRYITDCSSDILFIHIYRFYF